MWKQLFSKPPPDAKAKLWTPQRKVIYALFAFGPGTIWGLYLNSLRLEMNRENERLRLEYQEEEGLIKKEEKEKSDLLLQMIENIRTQMQELEKKVEIQDELLNKTKETTKKTTETITNKRKQKEIQEQWEEEKAKFLLLEEKLMQKSNVKASSGIVNSGIRERTDKQFQDRRKQYEKDNKTKE